MKAVVVQSHYAVPFSVEQCAMCGGIWLDAEELMRAPDAEIARLDPQHTPTLVPPAQVPTPLHCPKDSTVLSPFKDQNFPKEITIESCPDCGGMWFNRGELLQHRTQVRTPKESSDTHTSSAGRIAHAFLQLNKEHAQHARTRTTCTTLSREALISLISFLLAKPTSLLGSFVLHSIAIVTILLQTLTDEYENEIHIDQAELLALIKEVRDSGNKPV
jgi:Zn-finger nucleic acid-binding protein